MMWRLPDLFFREFHEKLTAVALCRSTVVTIMGKQCWSQAVLELGSWGHSVLQTPALVSFVSQKIGFNI